MTGTVVTWRNRAYCQLHLPLEAKEHKTGVSDEVAVHIQKAPDLRGIQLPPRQYIFNAKNVTTDLRNCVFAADVILSFRGTRHDLSGSIFGSADQPGTGRVTIMFAAHTTLVLDHIRAFSGLEIQPGQKHDAVDWIFKNSEFWGTLDVRGVCFKGSLDLSRAKFHAPIRFNDTEFPQQTQGAHISFERSALPPSSEGSYRSARVVFANQKNRELEGIFYACEKRCHRYSLGWGLRSWLPRALSAAYDSTSGYGHSYGKALAWLIATQVVFGFLYSWCSGRLQFDGNVDWSIVVFTVSQVVKPFELIAGRVPRTLDVIVASNGSPFLAMASVLHSIISLSLFALLLLAIRWRFRRD